MTRNVLGGAFTTLSCRSRKVRHSKARCGERRQHRGREQAPPYRPPGLRFGGPMAKNPDRAEFPPEDGLAGRHQRRLHLRGSGVRGDPQIQLRRLRLAGLQARRGTATEFSTSERSEIKKVALGRPIDCSEPVSPPGRSPIWPTTWCETQDRFSDTLRARVHDRPRG